MNLLLTNHHNLTHSHQKLITILETYIAIYKEDLHNPSWEQEVALVLQEARELQTKGRNFWITLKS
ncbi:hypothetical protein [Tenacibaculum sp. 190524A02b]|uniref:hypothetical protein n=1 Tax=Tenacibaculum vairaonense TaxID=3137860 RepID=UPI0031FA755C